MNYDALPNFDFALHLALLLVLCSLELLSKINLVCDQEVCEIIEPEPKGGSHKHVLESRSKVSNTVAEA